MSCSFDFEMELITETDAIHLASALAMKCGLNMKISSLSQCTSDFVLAIYLSIMGELPSEVLMESSSILSQEHNIACIVNSLALEYLHMDLSHILPVCFVAGDPTTVFNLLEILDGLLDFMLEQIEINIDSGDDGDVESEISLLQNHSRKKVVQRMDVTNGLQSPGQSVGVDSSENNVKISPTSDFNEEGTSDNVTPLLIREKTGLDGSRLASTFEVCYDSSEGDETSHPVLIKYLRKAKVSGEVDDEVKEAFAWKDTDSNANASEVTLDAADKGSGLIISGFTSESSRSDYELHPLTVNETSKKMPIDQYADGLDVADGVSKPEHNFRKTAPDFQNQETRTTDGGDRQWGQLFENLQKTVEESKRIREKYFATPQTKTDRIPDGNLNKEEDDSTTFNQDSAHNSPKKLCVHFKDTSLPETSDIEQDFEQVLQREQKLQTLKNKILRDNFAAHYDEVEEAERRRLIPLVKQVGNSEKRLKRLVSNKKKRKDCQSKKDLAAAAKWRSWQPATVVRKARFGRIEGRGDERLIIGEHDLLPTLISEFPGLGLTSATLNNAWRKQFRQMENITKNQSNYVLKKRLSEKKLEEMRNRHELLISLMQKEHEHNQRVRDAKQRANTKQEASRSVKERRQQSACVRRYYRDYQLQMRARMLKRRTREEKLFKNLFEEGLKIQRSRLNELRRYARDKRSEQQVRQRNEIESLENYYKDQFTMLAETLENEKKDLNIRNEAQAKLLRRMTAGLRHKMEQEISSLQEQIARDDDDIYFREVEADRVRRQLQMATYNVKFNAL